MGSPTIAAFIAQRVVVGIGELGISDNPSITLSTYSLGSCIGVAAYDPIMKAGGLLHLMLPDSSVSPEKAASQPAMFADTGLPVLFRALARLKGESSRLKIFVAGGASVWGANDAFRIGERNIQVTADYLGRAGYRVRHTALGGTVNRTVHLNVGTGEVNLKTPLKNDSFFLTA